MEKDIGLKQFSDATVESRLDALQQTIASKIEPALPSGTSAGNMTGLEQAKRPDGGSICELRPSGCESVLEEMACVSKERVQSDRPRSGSLTAQHWPEPTRVDRAHRLVAIGGAPC